MIKLASLIGIVLAVVCSFGLYQLKYQTADLKDDVVELKEQIAEQQELVHILRAEWNYINRPDNIRQLAAEYLPGLDEVQPKQLGEVTDIPYRPLSMEDLIDEIDKDGWTDGALDSDMGGLEQNLNKR